MYLRTAPASPFGRKVRMALHVVGQGNIEVRPCDFLDPESPLRIENPLGKMPVLTLDNGEHIYDSPVIIDYLDQTFGGLIPTEPWARIAARQLEALCDGILDAGVSIMMEKRLRPEDKQFPFWVEHQKGKMDRGLAALAEMGLGEEIHVGTLALASTLAWIDLRQLTSWRDEHPGLVDWFDTFTAALPAFEMTAPTH